MLSSVRLLLEEQYPSIVCMCVCLRRGVRAGGKSVNVTPTVACPQVTDSEYLVSSVVGTFIGTTLLYTVILIVSICALIYWNKKHR